MSHVDNLRNKDTEKKYKIDTLVKPLPEILNNQQKILIKGAVIEDNRQIENRSPDLPEFTVVFNIEGHHEDNYNDIQGIKQALGIEKMLSSPKNRLTTKETGEKARSNVVYSLSEDDVKTMMEYGVPKVTYSNDTNRPAVYSKVNKVQIESGKPLEGFRIKAIEEALAGRQVY